MNTFKWVVVFAGLQLVIGCASNKPSVTDAGAGVGSNRLPTVSQNQSRPEPVAVDFDQDGIDDDMDDCVGSTSGSLVDATGCEIVTGVIEGLDFAPGATELSVDSRIVLSKLVEVFLRYPEVVVSVEGHTDNRGSAADNLDLSKERVISVVRYMVASGMSPDQIKPFGYGESRPRAANATAEGREQNRRIEINVVEGLL